MTSADLPRATPDGIARAAALEGWSTRDVTPTSVVTFRSRGRVLIVGPADAAAEAAAQLDAAIDCVIAVPDEARPAAIERLGGRSLVRGGRIEIDGWLGAFEVTLVDATGRSSLGERLAPSVPRFDVVLDLSEPPLVQREWPPLGYYAVGADPAARADALAALPQLQGEFEKPKFFDYDPMICAHGRSGQPGCTRCIDACPAAAIVSIGDEVLVNPHLCQGGGTCVSVCPSGAMRYAYPALEDLLVAIRVLLECYVEHGGDAPCLLFHDAAATHALNDFGLRMPERLLPIAVEEIGSLGIDAWISCLAYGASAVVLLAGPRTPSSTRGAIAEQLGYAQAILEGMGYEPDCLRFCDAAAVETTLRTFEALPTRRPARRATFAAGREKRATLRLAVDHLYADARNRRRSVPLPAGAPFGEVVVDTHRCTLCMSCVGVCPTSALRDGAGLPQLRFREWSCVQCGLCEHACPEDAIELRPRFLYDAEARETPRVLNEEQPFCCIVCGKPFATKSMLEVLARKLEGHWMFQTEEAKRRLQMCEQCRVRDVYLREGAP
jgi:ferredoxin